MSRTQSLELQLTPMQVPDASPIASPDARPAASATDGYQNQRLDQLGTAVPFTQQLKVIPGEPSEMVIALHNTSRSSLFLQFRVSGNFPMHWCQLGTEDHELPAQQRMEAVLYFNIHQDFFENHQALQHQPSLDIDYSGQVQVYTNDARLIAARPFSLHLRPHSRYLKFLPAVYHEVDFIGRLLKIFEQSFDPNVQMLSSLWAYLDPLTAPAAMLPFLAQWVGWPSDGPWRITQQRHLISQALEIYRWRGTRKGLRLYLHLYTGLPLDDDPALAESQKHISIQETFSRGFLIGKTQLGQDAILGGGKPFHFTVQLTTPHPLDEPLIRTIIDQEKPAFCTYDLSIRQAASPASAAS